MIAGAFVFPDVMVGMIEASATRKPIDLGNGSDSNGAFDFMGGAKPGDAFDFVGSEIAKNKKSI